MDDNYYCAPKKYLVFHLKMSDHEKKSIVSVERCGKDPGIGASLHRLVHMDVLLTYWQFLRWRVYVYGGGDLDISLHRLVHMDVLLTYLQSISKSILMFILASSH